MGPNAKIITKKREKVHTGRNHAKLSIISKPICESLYSKHSGVKSITRFKNPAFPTPPLSQNFPPRAKFYSIPDLSLSYYFLLRDSNLFFIGSNSIHQSSIPVSFTAVKISFAESVLKISAALSIHNNAFLLPLSA